MILSWVETISSIMDRRYLLVVRWCAMDEPMLVPRSANKLETPQRGIFLGDSLFAKQQITTDLISRFFFRLYNKDF